MAELKCVMCGGTIVQDSIRVDQNLERSDGCHCTGCGIKFKPNLDELSKLFKDIRAFVRARTKY